MFIEGKTFAAALGALTFLSKAIPCNGVGFGRPAHGAHHARSLRATDGELLFKKSPDTACSDVSEQDLQQLQNQYTAFHGWINLWLQTGIQEDSATAIAQLKQELTAYDIWMSTWLDSALDGDGSVSSPPLSSAPLPQMTSIVSSQGIASPIGSSRSFISVAPFPTASATEGGSTPTGKRSPSQGLPFGTGASSYSNPSGTLPTSTASIATVSALPGTIISNSPNATASSSGPIETPSAVTIVSDIPSATASGSGPAETPSSGPSPPSSGSFNAKAKDNVAVYYGQTGATSQVKLSDLCADASVDIVILSFLTTFSGPGGYPTVNFGAACGGAASDAMTAQGATGLLSCPDLGGQIKTCQSGGKKVMLSLGGAEASSAFASDDEATKLASQLWDLFGAGTGVDEGLRPFGAGVNIDGFDIDNENQQPAHYTTLVTALRALYASDSSNSYYISAAPQCPTPDASIPLDAMKQMDFVWVQFYNNGPCNVGADGFLDSFKTWGQQLAGGPMLYIGAPACGGTACAGSGYVPPEQMKGVIGSAVGAGVGNLGGVMLWDGAEGYINKDGGAGNYMSVVKSALG